MLTAHQTEVLLSKLCIGLGFCLPFEDHDRILKSPPETKGEFVDAVVVAEGLDPETMDRVVLRQVRDLVAAAFCAAEEERALNERLLHAVDRYKD